MTTPPVLPDVWRRDARIPLAALAARMEVAGRNPARTVERWLKGERTAPAHAIAYLETISCGVVGPAGWAEARRQFLTDGRPPTSTDTVAAA